jgi:hypothetical protein
MRGVSTGAAAARSGLVTRPRLLAQVGQRFECRLVVVVGGAGFGKSTPLAQGSRRIGWTRAGWTFGWDARLTMRRPRIGHGVEVGATAPGQKWCGRIARDALFVTPAPKKILGVSALSLVGASAAFLLGRREVARYGRNKSTQPVARPRRPNLTPRHCRVTAATPKQMTDH